ncbi:RNA polymerase sigma factor [Actinoplanes sp. GCM10030250]|uniref:RNA polymerase sigma factor n=1 Tax=Actinoplanes sp. GCM10030250 TaxID=3273376 RepID=UPI00361E62CD
MMVGGGTAGARHAGSAHTSAVQPGGKPGDELGKPIPWRDVLATIKPELVDETRRQQEDLQRREGDRLLLAELASRNFAGPSYLRFEEELAAYAISVLRGWMHSGFIFQLTAARGFALNPSAAELEELHHDSDVRDELAIMTVALALPRFREQALVGRGWRFEGGASLSTYFMGTCLYVFPNELRKLRAQRRKWRLQDEGDPRLTASRHDPGNDPCLITMGNQQVLENLGRAGVRTRAVVALTIDGYSQEEIVELLAETSVRAVEGVLHRWRAKERSRRRGGASDE